MTIKTMPSMSKARRGRISCRISGKALKISVFFPELAGTLLRM